MASKKVKVSRADVYAARTRVELDKQNNQETPEWVVRVANLALGAPKRSGQAKRPASSPQKQDRNPEKERPASAERVERTIGKWGRITVVKSFGGADLPMKSPDALFTGKDPVDDEAIVVKSLGTESLPLLNRQVQAKNDHATSLRKYNQALIQAVYVKGEKIFHGDVVKDVKLGHASYTKLGRKDSKGS